MDVANNWKDYEILDMANGEKLERWGKYYTNKTRPTNNMERKILFPEKLEECKCQI